MLAKVLSSAVYGIDAYVVEVEVDIAHGLPSFSTVGLPDGAVRESKDRVKAAIKNSGYEFPPDRITVNLAPADIKKEGAAFDLPIALGILAAMGAVDQARLNTFLILGELSLYGEVKPVKGTLPVSIAARENGLRGVIIPKENANEGAVVNEIEVLPVKRLSEVVEFLNGERTLSRAKIDLDQIFRSDLDYGVDFVDVKGQQHVKRCLEVSAAGGHNVIMIGPPGSGKTMLARRLPSILI
jgi:magnesium chelatase family protein